MPVVIKASNNGFVDATKKLICLPSYLGLAGERREALRRAALTTAAAAAMAATALPAYAIVPPSTITDANASATIYTGSSFGLDNFSVNGINQVQQQWFWYRVGSTGLQLPINDLTQSPVVQTVPSKIDALYTGTYSPVGGTAVPFSVDVQYQILGGTNSATLAETITIQNTAGSGGGSLPMHFFQYSDFDLNASLPANQDTLVLSGTPTENTADQYHVGSSTHLNVSASSLSGSIVGAPDHYQVESGGGLVIENALSSTADLQLSDGSLTAGPGDVKWAWEWDPNIPASGSTTLYISSTGTITGVPEPASAMVMLGGVSLWGLRRPRRAKSAQAQRTT